MKQAQPLRKADKPLYQNEKREIRIDVAQSYGKPRVAETNKEKNK